MPVPKRQPESVTLDVKVVPGASRDQIVGWLGELLKVAVAQPPEGGKANDAVCRLLAARLGIPAADVTVLRGQTRPRKTLCVAGISRDQIVRCLPPKKA